MKKLLIVNNNLDMGGIQKSLINFLKATNDQYDITLLLLSKSGSLLKDIPEGVKVITPNRCYGMLGLTKQELKSHPVLFVLKAFLMSYTKLFSRRGAMRLLGLFQKKISGYDVVISYSHLPTYKYFANGCGDFVLDKTVCDTKICLIHCDYLNSGCLSQENNRQYQEFQKIACCSESVRERFLQGAPIDPEKVFTLRNFYDLGILEQKDQAAYAFDDRFINLVFVARLSSEKGIFRAMEALCTNGRKDVRMYFVGNGPLKGDIERFVAEHKMEEQVFLLGEQKNPYQYMRSADYLMVPSFHEAAPMVFDEAKLLGLPILATNTTSAAEMIGAGEGIVCENSTEGLEKALAALCKPEKKTGGKVDNCMQLEQLEKLLSVQ